MLKWKLILGGVCTKEEYERSYTYENIVEAFNVLSFKEEYEYKSFNAKK